MTWTKMRFRDAVVWVKVDAAGRPVIDGGGRAEMKYREADERTYRPAAANLAPAGPTDAAPSAPASRRPSAGGRSRGGSPGPAAADAVHVWTDGACSGNPGPMAIGVVVLVDERRRELGEYIGRGTNNIAELVAIERGLELAGEMAPEGGRPLRVYSDSGYAIGLLSQGWKAKANQDLVARLRARVNALPDITFVKVAGHAGVPENERCDALARAAIENATLPR